MGKLKFYGGQGHTEVTWDTEEDAAVKEAERIFKEALAQGGAAFKLDNGVDAAERLYDFAPDAEEIAVIFPVAGG